MDDKKSVFEQVGGRPILEKVSKIFYDKVYEHPWIGLYFKEVKQDIIEVQQVDFMTQNLGGPTIYFGKMPIPAHKHMVITDELFELRKKLTIEALDEAQAPELLKEKWLKIDNAFRNQIVKKSVSECEKRFVTDEFLDFKKAG